ncbi:MAG: LysR family transcriptional regulator [Myxococcota bacterium]
MHSVNWSDLSYVMALGRAGTLSAAARELRVDHATVARRIGRLEDELGAKLFDKTPDGYRSTTAGRVVQEAGRDVETRFASMRLSIEQHTAPASGRVRIAAVETFFSELLRPHLVDFRDRYPDIELTMDASGDYRDLSRKEAEIAVRSPKPKMPNLICRRALRVGAALYASRPYAQRFGLPRSLGDATGHFLVRYADELNWLPDERWLNKHVRGARSPVRACSMQQLLSLVREGVGFGLIECLSGDPDPNLVRLPTSPTMNFTYWLVVHEEAYKASRVRAVLDFLTDVCRDVERQIES